MKKCLLVVFCCALLGASAAQADPILYSTVLTGPAEFVPNASPALGFAFVTYDASLQTLGVMVGFGGLTAPTTASHIHCCVDPPGAAGVATTVPTFPGFPTGVTSGSYDHTLDLTDPASFNSAFLLASGGTPLAAEMMLAEGLASGRAYLNIHTSAFPAGEIRGFLTAVSGPSVVPEPTSFVLLGTGLLGAVAVRRWRRQKA